MTALRAGLIAKRAVAAIGWAIIAFAINGTALADTLTAFSLTSSPDSWIGQGRTLTVTPLDGFSVNGNGQAQSYVQVTFVKLGVTLEYFYLSFTAPDGGKLQVGHYDDIQTRPFNGNALGLDFSSNGHADSKISGFVDILELSNNPDGSLKAFAANFLQNDEANPMWWNMGEIRYNSSIALTPVPEPSSYALMLLGLSTGWLAMRKSGHLPRKII